MEDAPPKPQETTDRTPAAEREAPEAVGATSAVTPPVLPMDVWREVRPYVKDLLGEIVIFAIALGGLELFRVQVHWSQMTELRKELLEAVHFWTFFFVFVIFGASFIIQVAQRRYRKLFEVKAND